MIDVTKYDYCKEHLPGFTKLSGTHNSRCWLNHPMASGDKGKGGIAMKTPLISAKNIKKYFNVVAEY